MATVGAGIKRFVLWDHARASWQYDVIVGLILAFIFLTPREFFNDQPKPRKVILASTENGTSRFVIEPELVTATDELGRLRQVEGIIHSQIRGKNRVIERVEAIFDDEKELQGYVAYTRP